MWHNGQVNTSLQNGKNIPILNLQKYMNDTINQWADEVEHPVTLPCHNAAQRLSKHAMEQFLDNAGEQRFLAKANRFQANLAKMEASQLLYQGIMGALGYSKNKLSFQELACRLPLQILESITRSKVSDEACLAQQQALLLGTAGLLPSQRQINHHGNDSDDTWRDKLERLWISSEHSGAMSSNAWHLFKVRPNNSPIHRLIAMSYLLLRYRKKGIFEELVNIVKEAPASKGYRRFEKGLTVTTRGYRTNQFDSGTSGRIKNPTLLGSRRAADITVNILLPFSFAWGRLTLQPELEKKAWILYLHHPKLATNSVERHMREQLGMNSDMVNSAQRQQGLIHIHNTLCIQGGCNCCPLGKP